MTKAKKCKVCGKDSWKRTVCKECKRKQPYKASAKGQTPFQRQLKGVD